MYYATGVSTSVLYIHVYNSNNNNIIIIPVAAGRDIRCAQVSARGPVAGSPGPSGRPGHRSSDGQRGHTAGRFRTGPLRRPGPELRAPVHTASRPCGAADRARAGTLTRRRRLRRRRRRRARGNRNHACADGYHETRPNANSDFIEKTRTFLCFKMFVFSHFFLAFPFFTRPNDV